MTSDRVVPGDGGALVRPSVSPNAKGTWLGGPYGDAALKLRVAAPPVGGKAIAEVERFVAEKVGVEFSRVRVVRGLSGRDKTVFVDGIDAARVRRVLLSRPL